MSTAQPSDRAPLDRSPTDMSEAETNAIATSRVPTVVPDGSGPTARSEGLAADVPPDTATPPPAVSESAETGSQEHVSLRRSSGGREPGSISVEDAMSERQEWCPSSPRDAVEGGSGGSSGEADEFFDCDYDEEDLDEDLGRRHTHIAEDPARPTGEGTYQAPAESSGQGDVFYYLEDYTASTQWQPARTSIAVGVGTTSAELEMKHGDRVVREPGALCDHVVFRHYLPDPISGGSEGPAIHTLVPVSLPDECKNLRRQCRAFEGAYMRRFRERDEPRVFNIVRRLGHARRAVRDLTREMDSLADVWEREMWTDDARLIHARRSRGRSSSDSH